jgi:hypothetical protein
MALPAKLNQTLRGQAPRVLNVLNRRGLDVCGSRAVASFAFDPRPHVASGVGGVAIETPGDHTGDLFLPERGFDIGRRVHAVPDRQPRAIACRVPGNPVFEIAAFN